MSKKNKKRGPVRSRAERERERLAEAQKERAGFESSNGQKTNVENGHEGSSKEIEIPEGREISLNPEVRNSLKEGLLPLYEQTRDVEQTPKEYQQEIINSPEYSFAEVKKAIELGYKEHIASLRQKER